ncbi:MAG: hypothetical protein VX970_12475 [Planctomycetota bacterium]|nr:hypothetical protein [Planctomycetota bacterium]
MSRPLTPTIRVCFALIAIPISGTLVSGAITAAKPLIDPFTAGDQGKKILPETLTESPTSEVPARKTRSQSVLTLTQDKQFGNRQASGSNTIRTHHKNGNLKSEREVRATENGTAVNHGKFRLWDSQGGLIAIGNYQDGEPAGNWKRIYRDTDGANLLLKNQTEFNLPLSSTFQFSDGVLDGLWKIVDASGRTVRKWSFSQGKLHGEMAVYFSSGSRLLSANYNQNVPTGTHREWTNEGKLVEALHFEHGRLLADVKYRWPDGTIQATGRQLQPRYRLTVTPDWWNGRINVKSSEPIGQPQKIGDWTYYTRRGKSLQKGTYVRGEREGLFTWWYPDGQLHARGDFIAGSPHGEWTWWHANGEKKTVGFYSHGTHAGDWVSWDDEGRQLEIVRHAPSPELHPIRPPTKKPSTQRIQRRSIDIPLTADRDSHRNHQIQAVETIRR